MRRQPTIRRNPAESGKYKGLKFDNLLYLKPKEKAPRAGSGVRFPLGSPRHTKRPAYPRAPFHLKKLGQINIEGFLSPFFAIIPNLESPLSGYQF